MNLTDCLNLFGYTEWANDQMLTCAERLSEEQWTRDLGSSFPSIQKTVAHIAGAERAWLLRWQGESPKSPPEWMKDPSVAVLKGVLAEVQAERARFLNSLTEADLNRTIHFTFLNGTSGSGPLGSLFLHVINHSTYHRGQVATMLRQVGGTPLATDLYVYMVIRAASEGAPQAP
jgi:uncharacterized damage-inducible protein DinB